MFPGRFEIKGEISVPQINLPSSARILTASATVITNSRPSLGMWLYTPLSMALSRVDLP